MKNRKNIFEASVALLTILAVFTGTFLYATQPSGIAQTAQTIDPTIVIDTTVTSTTTLITNSMGQVDTAVANLLTASTTLAAQRTTLETDVKAMVAMVLGEAEKQATQTTQQGFNITTLINQQQPNAPLNQLAQMNTFSQVDVQNLVNSSVQTLGLNLSAAQSSQLLTNVTQALSVPNLAGGQTELAGVISQNIAALTGQNAATIQTTLLTPTIGFGFNMPPVPTAFMTTSVNEIRSQLIDNVASTLSGQLSYGMSNAAISNSIMSSLGTAIPAGLNISGYQSALNGQMLGSIGNVTNSIAYLSTLQSQLGSTLTQLTDYKTQLTTELQNQLTGNLLNSFDFSQLNTMAQFTSTASLLSGNLQQTIQNQIGGMVNQIGGQLLSATGLGSLTSLGSVFANGLSLNSFTSVFGLSTSLGALSGILNTGIAGQLGALGSIVGGGAFGFGSAPFGGRILTVESCSCSGNWRVRLSPPRGGYYIYSPTVTYMYGPPLVVGRWALGMSGGMSVCSKLTKFCSPVGTHNLMTIVGTSQF